MFDVPAAPAPAREPAPTLSVSVTDGRWSAGAGNRLAYVLTVTNEGDAALQGLRLEQRIPAPAGGLTAGQGGRVGDGVVSWRVDLPAHGRMRLRAGALVGRGSSSDARLSRLTVTACAFPAGSGAAAACAADVDRLTAAGGQAGRVLGEREGRGTTLAGIAATLAAVVGGALLVLRQRSLRFRPDTATSADTEDQTA